MRAVTLWLLFTTVLVGCNAAVGLPSPAASPSRAAPSAGPTLSTTPVPTPSPSATGVRVTSAAQAAALVFASNPLFATMTPLEPDTIGQAAWYEAGEHGDGYSVMVTMGSGDCMAGCIDRHTWNYVVDRAGTVSLDSEEGDEVELSPSEGTSGPATVTVRLTAGPVCPVEQSPPDPDCAARSVANAEVVVRDPTGAEIARGVSDRDGMVVFSVRGGAYYVEPSPVEGLMAHPQPVAFAVQGGSAAAVTATYDTGIR